MPTADQAMQKRRASDTERFAPSPTGPLHLGHAYSALLAHDAARASQGRFLLRLEDLDRGRVRPEHVDGILEDLAWLGITFDAPPLFQSARAEAHDAALQALTARGLVYRCVCSRRDVREAAAAPQEGADPALDGILYPGTCRGRDVPAGPAALRLDLEAAIRSLGGDRALSDLSFDDLGEAGGDGATRHRLDPARLRATVGDIVLRRRDGAAAYHLAVVVDDAHQGITHVTRGADLFPSTAIHRVLQALLGLPTPIYRHHRLIRDDAGRRLAKRDDARALATLREAGISPSQIRAMVGLASLGPAQ
ncbi:MAG: tRNA glutamyl-Q(34) synthetase GluQRS [Pseudomonadota bacterium]